MSLMFSSVFTYDTDAGNYIQAVEAADEADTPGIGALEPAVRQAINNFVVGCKQDGIWDAIKASCILAGAKTLEGSFIDLKSGTKILTNNNFADGTYVGSNYTTGDYDRKTGLKGNGSTKYLDSGRNNNADPQDSNHNAIYISTANSVDPAILMGDGAVLTVGNNRIVFASTLSINLHFDSRSDAGGSVSGHPVNPTGFVAHSRSSASSALFRVANATTSYTMASTTPTSTNVHVFSRESGGVPSNARLAFYSIGESLDLALLDGRVTDLINKFAEVIP